MNASATRSPVAIAAAEEALRALAKAQRAMQLYLPNNPTRTAALGTAKSAFAKLWAHEPALDVVVKENSLEWSEQVVYHDAERAAEGLPWLLHRDGIRALTFEEGFEEASLEPFLALLQHARNAHDDDDDLVTLLWVADLSGLHYRHVEADNTYDGIVDRSALVDIEEHRFGNESAITTSAPLAMVQFDAEGHEVESLPGVINTEGFDTTLHFLDAREVAYLQEELTREYAVNLRRRAFGMLLDIVEMPDVGQSQRQALEHIDALLLDSLAAADYEQVGFVLREAAVALSRGEFSDDIAASLRALPTRLSEPTVMAQLLQALDDNRETRTVTLLEEFIGQLHPTALQPIAAWLGSATDSLARRAIEHAAVALAGAHTSAMSPLLEHVDPATVRGAIWIARQLATPAAVPGLAKVLRSDQSALRAAAISALAAIGSPAALRALERGIDDVDREVRMATYRAILNRRTIGALPRLAQAVRKKEVRDTDLAERMMLFEAYGALCGDAGVSELDALLNARGFLGAKENPETRACAARALGLIATPSALTALQRASEAKEPVVRSAVSRALRGGE